MVASLAVVMFAFGGIEIIACRRRAEDTKVLPAINAVPVRICCFTC
ncbi:hypothetical protein M8494_23530 [Serratia ureilytica]